MSDRLRKSADEEPVAVPSIFTFIEADNLEGCIEAIDEDSGVISSTMKTVEH